MKNKGLMIVLSLALVAGLLGVLPAPRALAATCDSTGSGNWDITSTWSCGHVPVSGDVTTIKSGHTVTVAAAATGYSVTVQSGGQVTVNSGFTWTIANEASATDLSISGTVLNQGTLTIAASAAWAVNSGGTFIHNTATAISTPLDRATFAAASNFTYRGSSSLTPSVSMSGRTFGNLSFESTSGTWSTGLLSGGTATVIQGNFALGTGVTFNNNTLVGLTIAGNWTNNGTFTSGSGTVTFNGTSTQTFTGATTFYGLTVNSGSTLKLTSGAKATNSFSQNGTLEIGSGGFVDNTGLAPTYGASSLLKYSSGAAYGRGKEWSAASGAGYPNDIQIATNTTLNPGGNSNTGTALNLARDLTIDSGSSLYMDYSGNNMTVPLIVGRNFAINGNLSLSGASGGDMNVAGNWTHGTGTFTPNGRAVFFNGTGTQTLSAASSSETFNYLVVNKSSNSLQLSSTDVTVNASTGDALYIQNGSIDLNGRTLTLSGSGGNLRVENGSRTITGSGGTVSFTGAKTVSGGGTLTFDSNITVKVGATVDFGASKSTINGTLRMESGAYVSSNSPTYGGSSTLVYTGDYSQSANTKEWVAGTALGAGVPQNVTVLAGTVTLAGDRTAVGVLTVNASATLDTSVNTLSVNGSVTNNGTLKQTRTVNSTTVTFLNIKNSAGTTDKYFGVQIATTNNLGSTVVSVSGNQVCSQANGFPVKRCFIVDPANSASADLTFYYTFGELQGQTPGNLKAWKYNGTSWSQVSPSGTTASACPSGINCSVAVTGVSTYGPPAFGPQASSGPFALKESSPQAVTMADFSAAQTGDAVLLTWETVSELENRGFNLYRGVDPSAPDRQLNDALIPSQSQGNPGGFIYTWEDRADLVPGTTYYYWVEDVDIYGAATRHGPVSVDYGAPTAVRLLDAGAVTTLPLAMPLIGAGLLALAGLAATGRRRS